MDDADHAKSGPPNPATGIDQPTPPGGPQRVDAPQTDQVPDGREPQEDTDPAPRDVVEENAETSLDQPSDG